MKTNVVEMRRLNDADLQKQLEDSYQEMFNLRFQHASGQVKNTNRFKEVKKQIARIKTLQRERELARAHAAPAANKGAS